MIFQLHPHTAAISLHQILRCILFRKTKFLNDFYFNVDTRKKLIFNQLFQFINVFFMNPAVTDDMYTELCPLSVARHLCNRCHFQPFPQIFSNVEAWKCIKKISVHSFTCFYSFCQ